jgi:hypothetical protein
MMKYCYNPLPQIPGTKYIRVLLIHPGNHGNIRLEFLPEPVCIDDEPSVPYEALSYVWGSEEDPVEVDIISPTNHHQVPITQNLAGALRQLRDPDHPRIFWIDSLCIDQSNVVEKGHQVGFMGDVYERAKHVTIWLGPEADDSCHGLRILEEIGSQIDVDWGQWSIHSSPGARDKTLADRTVPFPYSQRDADAVKSVLWRPWFERVWVRQEVALARNATFQAGVHTISRSDMQAATQCINKKSTSDPLGQVGHSPRCWLARSMCMPPVRFSLMWLDFYTEGMKCKDPRDRIYGQLRLLDGFESTPITPDYSLTTAQVYQDVTLKYIMGQRSLNIFANCSAPKVTEQRGPSWVPNWETDLDRNLTGLPFTGGRMLLSCATHKGNGVLSVTGIECATIASTSIANPTSRLSALKNLKAACVTLLPPDILQINDISGIPLLEALCITVSCGRFLDSFHPPDPDYWDQPSAKVLLKKLLTEELPPTQELLDSDLQALGFRVQGRFRGRKFFTTSEGHFGLGPQGIEPGDKVCLLLGSEAPIVLRPTADRKYVVAGDCFMHGIMSGEPLLGPLPNGVREIMAFAEGETDFQIRFLDKETAETTLIDPRIEAWGLGLLPSGIYKGENGEPRYEVEPDALRKLGIDVRSFELV